MEDKALRGIPWTMLSYVANRFVSVATTILLARLLVPADFGLFALATLGTGFISIFSGLGLGSAIVMRQDMDRRGQGTVLSLLLLSGLAFAGVLAALSPLLADLFDEPRLRDVLLALAAILSISGMNWFYDSLLTKELEFRRRFMTQIIRTVVFSATALALAATGSGVWALVGAHIAGHAANTIAQLVLAPYRVRPAWDRTQIRGVFSDGAGFVLQDGSQFLQQNADYLVTGRVLGTSQLGFYSMAYRQAELPYYAIAEPVSRVTFPSFSRMRHRGEDIFPGYLGSLRMVALASLPLGVVLSAAAEPFTDALFGPKWPAMIGPLAVLGIWAVVRPLEVTAATLLNTLGHAGFVGKMSMALLVPQVLAIWAAAEAGGITAVAWVMLAHIVIALVLVAGMIQRVGGPSVLEQGRHLRPMVLAAAGSWVATRALAAALDGAPSLLSLMACTAVGLLVYVGLIALLSPDVLRSAWAQGRRMVGRGRPS